jgi:hypothetical protein
MLKKKGSVYTVVVVEAIKLAVKELRQLIARFPLWRPGSGPSSGHVGFLGG